MSLEEAFSNLTIDGAATVAEQIQAAVNNGVGTYIYIFIYIYIHTYTVSFVPYI